MTHQLELISFDLCPFVQRSVITLLKKGVNFETRYIDLANKPEWFLKLSPLGKVPVLNVGGTVLFESAVINEYLDEAYGERMLKEDVLKRATQRAWIEAGSAMIMDHYGMCMAQTQETLELKTKAMHAKLRVLESYLEARPSQSAYFSGEAFSLVDAAYAPLFLRVRLAEKSGQCLSLLETYPQVSKWADVLCADKEVIGSCIDNFEQRFVRYFEDKASVLLTAA